MSRDTCTLSYLLIFLSHSIISINKKFLDMLRMVRRHIKLILLLKTACDIAIKCQKKKKKKNNPAPHSQDYFIIHFTCNISMINGRHYHNNCIF